MHELIKHNPRPGNENQLRQTHFPFPKNELLKTGNTVFFETFLSKSPLEIEKRKFGILWGIWGASKGYFWRHSGLSLVKKLTWTASYPQIQPCWFPFSRNLPHSMSISDYNSPSKKTSHLEPAVGVSGTWCYITGEKHIIKALGR